MPTVPPSAGRPRRGSARQRSAELRAAERRATRRRRVAIWFAAAVAVIASAVGVTAAVRANSHHPSAVSRSDTANNILAGPVGPEGIVLEEGQELASASTAADGQPIDGIQCSADEQVAYHIHTHLTVYVNGVLRPIPPGIGIVAPITQQTANGAFDSATRCYYWLHVHAQDGIIHVESPNATQYTLGQFFAIWKQPLTSDQVGAVRGTLTVFVNGVRRTGDPAAIPLESHEDIQIDVGTPVVAAQGVDWSKAQL